ncbi:PREDICTED: uncharacterized protein LOC108559067 [Nicrophorus vespilloides]|uniref:Uncharacterized protein LOC108559067 n=1 Tax=Nicrophorus vespilloides TaxID=110193 RepID=A0ABM1MAT5_NICVS|nr:PREDICTED: uncharacterized protein LOC108559067 [Nicrophorus vespilloides]
MEMSRTMKMLFLVFGLIQISYGGLFDDDCSLDGVDVGIFGEFKNEAIKDKHTGIVKEFTKGGITDVHTTDSKYLKARIDGDKIIVETTQRYSDIEYELESTNSPKIRTTIKLTCENGTSSFTFSQPIIDENNNTPFFNRKVYRYRFGMEVNKDFVLTELLSIYATDIDLSHKDLVVTIEDNDYLEIKPLNKWDSMQKTTHYQLVAKKHLSKMDKTFEIIVSDTENTSKASINLVVE